MYTAPWYGVWLVAFKAQDGQFKDGCLSASSCHCGPTTSYCQADAGVLDDDRSVFFWCFVLEAVTDFQFTNEAAMTT